MNNDNISFKRLTDEELAALKGMLVGKKKIDFDQVDEFMSKMNKEEGLFDNCSATICKGVFVVQRPIGWV